MNTNIYLVAGFSFMAWDATKMALPSFFSSSLLFCFLLPSPTLPQSSFLNSELIRLIVGFAFKTTWLISQIVPLSRCNILKALFSILISLLKDQIKVLWGSLRLFWVPVIPSKLDNVLLLFLFSSSLAFYLAITCIHFGDLEFILCFSVCLGLLTL